MITKLTRKLPFTPDTMTKRPSIAGCLSTSIGPLFFLLISPLIHCSSLRAQNVPEDLFGDEHVREEFGINDFTTPSIRKLFDELDKLGTLPYEILRRDHESRPPPDRSKLALTLGVLIADGFLAVQCEKVDELEPVGKAILDYARAIGAHDRVSKHAKSLLEGSLLGNWSGLRMELAATQADVEAEMVLLRDSEIAHLISLGGWIRAFQIASTTTGESYTPEKTRTLGRSDIIDYYLSGLEDLHPSLQEKEHIKQLREGIASVRDLVDVPEGMTFQPAEVARLREIADGLIALIVDK
jgi:hypothetical protein